VIVKQRNPRPRRKLARDGQFARSDLPIDENKLHLITPKAPLGNREVETARRL
jgi:hypothetical protein